MKSKNGTDWDFSNISKYQKLQEIQQMNSDMYPNSGYDVPICFVYLNFFTKNIFPSRMIIDDQYESPHHQFSIQICLKKKMLSTLKHQVFPF